MLNFVMDLGSVASRFINVLAGGSPDLSFSAQSHLERPKAAQRVDWLAFTLVGETDHCRRAWEWEVDRSRRNVARAEE